VDWIRPPGHARPRSCRPPGAGFLAHDLAAGARARQRPPAHSATAPPRRALRRLENDRYPTSRASSTCGRIGRVGSQRRELDGDQASWGPWPRPPSTEHQAVDPSSAAGRSPRRPRLRPGAGAHWAQGQPQIPLAARQRPPGCLAPAWLAVRRPRPGTHQHGAGPSRRAGLPRRHAEARSPAFFLGAMVVHGGSAQPLASRVHFIAQSIDGITDGTAEFAVASGWYCGEYGAGLGHQ